MRQKRRTSISKGRKSKKASRTQQRGPFKKPNTAKQYFSLSGRDRQTWNSVGHAISKMREGLTLPKAAKEFGLSTKAVISLGRSALRKQRNGRYAAKKTDQLLRVVNVLTTEGRKEIATRDSRQASAVGAHWSAVQKFLNIGDDTDLVKFAKKKIVDSRRKRFTLLTDLLKLEELGSAGTLRFESMYAGGAQ